MNIIFRVDASIEVGSGHVMRCLTLAEQFRGNNDTIEFICRKAEGSMECFIEEKGFKVHVLPEVKDSLWTWTKENWKQDADKTKVYLTDKKIDLVIVDHYAIDEKWEKDIRPYARKLMVIDDLANRKHNCDLLLDHNIYKDKEKRYIDLIPSNTVQMLGAKYALLRDEFFSEVHFQKSTIFVSFGGSDPTNETLKVLNVLAEKNLKYEIVVVVGASNPNKKQIKEFMKNKTNMKYLFNISNMAEEMNRASLVIGAGGVSTLERIALRVPSLVITVADNQVEIAKNLSELGVIKYLGHFDTYLKEDLSKELDVLLAEGGLLLKTMAKECRLIMPSGNSTLRVMQNIRELLR